MSDRALEPLPGLPDLLVLKVVSVGSEHGLGVGQRLQRMSRGVLDVKRGSLYPALQRLLKKGWITSEWRGTENGRQARYWPTRASVRSCSGSSHPSRLRSRRPASTAWSPSRPPGGPRRSASAWRSATTVRRSAGWW